MGVAGISSSGIRGVWLAGVPALSKPAGTHTMPGFGTAVSPEEAGHDEIVDWLLGVVAAVTLFVDVGPPSVDAGARLLQPAMPIVTISALTPREA